MIQNEPREPDLLSLREHARRLGYALRTVQNAVSAGSWPVRIVRIGGKRLVPMCEHQRLLAQVLREAGIEPPAAQPQPQPQPQPAKRAPGRPRRVGGRP